VTPPDPVTGKEGPARMVLCLLEQVGDADDGMRTVRTGCVNGYGAPHLTTIPDQRIDAAASIARKAALRGRMAQELCNILATVDPSRLAWKKVRDLLDEFDKEVGK